jgi:hypothetical protein
MDCGVILMKLTKSQKLFLIMNLRELLVTFRKGTEEQVSRLKAVTETGIKKLFGLKDTEKVQLLYAPKDEEIYIEGILTLMEEVLACEEEPEDAEVKVTEITPNLPPRGHRKLRRRK